MIRFAARASCIALAFAVGCATDGGPSTTLPAGLDQPPAAPREFRAAWVATVDNIDWPSKKGLPSDQQRAEALAILDRAQQLKLNCLIVQVRATADAFYPSNLEPWSSFLTGQQGVAPQPPYDPLRFWVDEGHKRGIEIHAWFNPYRARYSAGQTGFAASHVSRRRPDLVKEYGPYLWLDPGEPDSARHSLAVFDDVVRRYDIDGVHIDDYFYPYQVKASWREDAKEPNPSGAEVQARAARPNLDFPDDASWAKHKAKNPVQPNPATAPADVERVARHDWRRQNVNRLVEAIHLQTKRAKPWVKFGISPFGLGRPGTAPGIKGFDQYEQLYADAALWLRNGWCDYFTPQLYWKIEQREQSFPVLLDYWRSENKQGKHIWPGLFTSKVGDPKRSYEPGEIVDQIAVTRARTGAGHVHFSMKALQPKPGQAARAELGTLLAAQTYTQDALVPASPWMDDQAPPTPRAALKSAGGNGSGGGSGAVELTLAPGAGERTWQFGVWRAAADGQWVFHVVPGATRTVRLPGETRAVVVTAVDRVGNESRRVTATVGPR